MQTKHNIEAPSGWRSSDLHAVRTASSFYALRLAAEQAIRWLKQSPTRNLAGQKHGLVFVTGPFTETGGKSFETNIAQLSKAIEWIDQLDCSVFDRVPVDIRARELEREWHEDHGAIQCCQPLIEELYRPLLVNSGMFGMLVQLPEWERCPRAILESEIFGIVGPRSRARYELPGNWAEKL